MKKIKGSSTYFYSLKRVAKVVLDESKNTAQIS